MTSWRPGLKVLRHLANHGPERTMLKLRTGLLKDQVIFRFIHPALTLDRETLAHLFERNGSEMDLAIVRGVILAHGGRIWANSTPTQGLPFTSPSTPQPRTHLKMLIEKHHWFPGFIFSRFDYSL